MSLCLTFKDSFEPTDRFRGMQYFRNGDVARIQVKSGRLVAEVASSRDSFYDVTIDLESLDNEGSLCCTCPRFAGGYNCKHIWAAILEFDLNFSRTINRSGNLGNTKQKASAAGNQQKNSKPANPSKTPAWQKLLKSISVSNHNDSKGPSSLFESLANQVSEIYYVIDAASGSYSEDAELMLSVKQRIQKKDGTWGKLKPLKLEHQMACELVDPSDRRIANALLGVDRGYADPYGYHYETTENRFSEFDIWPDWSDELCTALCQSGRLFWTIDDNEMIEEMHAIKSICFDPPAEICISIETLPESKAESRLNVGIMHRGSLIDPQSIVQIDDVGICLLKDALICIKNEKVIELWRSAQQANLVKIKKSERSDFLKQLAQVPGLPNVCFPEDWQVVSSTAAQPIGLLKLKNTDFAQRDLTGKISFLYGETELLLTSSQTAIFDQATNQWTPRNSHAESSLLRELLSFPIIDATNERYSDHDFKVNKINLLRMVDELGSKGWRITLHGKPIKHSGTFEMFVESGQDWFDLSAQVSFDGETIPLPSLLQAIAKNEQFITLADGSQGRVPSELIEKYAKYAKFGQVEDDRIRFRPTQAMLLDALLESQPEVRLDKGFQQFRDKLKSFTGIKPKPAPKTFAGDLRKYQAEGLGWLHFLREFKFGGCLADDMGLGKTIQVLALLESRRTRRATKATAPTKTITSIASASASTSASGSTSGSTSTQAAKSKTKKTPSIAVAATKSKHKPSIVVVPKSLIFNWIDEASRFTPKLRFFNYTGIDRKRRATECDGFDVLITTYGTMRKDIEALSAIEFDYAILDESQAIKNSKALCAKSSRLLRADHRLAMTGTPIENHLGELWSLFEFLNPGMLGQSTNFAKLTNQKKSNEAEREDTLNSLAKAIQPFLLRRTKDQVLTDLPPKTEQTLTCEMLPAQKKKYEELKEYYRVKLAKKIDTDGIGRSKIQVLEALLRLRQVACDPRLLDATARPGAKLDLLEQQIGEIVSEGHKVLVFSQFTKLLGLVKQQFDALGITYEYLDGKTTKRAECVNRFQTDPNVSVFLISLKAGGHGLNLTAADYVFLLDPWWNPAVEAQAIDRAHRMGQQNPVIAYRMICQDTVEEKIVALQESKRKLADSVISSDESLIRSLTAEDLQLLLM